MAALRLLVAALLCTRCSALVQLRRPPTAPPCNVVDVWLVDLALASSAISYAMTGLFVRRARSCFAPGECIESFHIAFTLQQRLAIAAMITASGVVADVMWSHRADIAAMWDNYKRDLATPCCRLEWTCTKCKRSKRSTRRPTLRSRPTRR